MEIIMNNRLPNIHPGEILQLEFLEPMNITPYRLSKDIGVGQTRISEILSGKRSVTADTALRLSRYFGNSAQFWLNLQTQYDLRQALEENAEVYNQISKLGVNDVAWVTHHNEDFGAVLSQEELHCERRISYCTFHSKYIFIILVGFKPIPERFLEN